jgi:hypothetical protein
MTDLDKDFELIAEKINAKLAEAASSLDEANRLADEAGLPTLIYTQYIDFAIKYDRRDRGLPEFSKQEMSAKCKELQEKLEHIDVSGLESAMGSAGWSTSSSYC